MDPTISILDSLDQVTPQRTTIAPSEPVAPERTTSAPSELVAPVRTMSAPAGNGATDKVVIEVDGDYSPLSSASPGLYIILLGLYTVPVELCARAYSSTHEDRRDFTATRA